MTMPPPRRDVVSLLRPVAVIVLVVLAGVGVVSAASWLGGRVGSGLGGTDATDSIAVEPGLGVEVTIPEGATASQIADILAAAGVVRSSTGFEAAVRTSGSAGSLRAGRYELVTGMNPDDVIDILRRGPIVSVFDVTVPEGLRVGEILDRLSEISGIPVAAFEEALRDGSVHTDITDLGDDPEPSDWEGLLFPDTYRFSERATAADMLQRMAFTMEERMATIDWTGLEEAGFTPYEGIVIASLIESEVRVADERPLVSSVIRNRLADGQRLEIDATVLYALGTRDVAEFDREVDSPYNTYRVPGLPPTPISAPGRAALEAAANPAETDYRYYVLSSEDGRHTFSVTFEEHQAAVAEAREAGIIP